MLSVLTDFDWRLSIFGIFGYLCIFFENILSFNEYYMYNAQKLLCGWFIEDKIVLKCFAWLLFWLIKYIQNFELLFDEADFCVSKEEIYCKNFRWILDESLDAYQMLSWVIWWVEILWPLGESVIKISAKQKKKKKRLQCLIHHS